MPLSIAAGSAGARGHLRADDGWSGRRARRTEDRDDRRYLPEGKSNGDQHARQKKRGRLISRTKGGMPIAEMPELAISRENRPQLRLDSLPSHTTAVLF